MTLPGVGAVPDSDIPLLSGASEKPKEDTVLGVTVLPCARGVVAAEGRNGFWRRLLAEVAESASSGV
jgi:hypothetical protein